MRFSIIIPVYNVESYLQECIESVLKQSCKDFEIILVNDGSTDDSGKMCDRYASQHSNICAIHQENKGLSEARNIAIGMAKGDYLLFLDSDDYYLEPDFLKELSNKSAENDIVVYNLVELYELNNQKLVYHKGLLPIANLNYKSGKDYLVDALQQFPLYPWYVCLYAVKRSFWIENKFNFRAGIKYEDVELTYQILCSAESVYVVPTIHYVYRRNRPNSTVTTVNLSTMLDILTVIKGNILEVERNDLLSKKLKVLLNNNFSCMYYSVMIFSSQLSKNDRRLLVNELINENWICKHTTNKSQKVVFLFIKLFGVNIVCYLLGIRRRLKSLIKRARGRI